MSKKFIKAKETPKNRTFILFFKEYNLEEKKVKCKKCQKTFEGVIKNLVNILARHLQRKTCTNENHGQKKIIYRNPPDMRSVLNSENALMICVYSSTMI